MANYCDNRLVITLPEAEGEDLYNRLLEVLRGVDPERGAVNLGGLFPDFTLNDVRNEAGVGLLEILAPRYTFDSENPTAAYREDPFDIWGTSDVEEFGLEKETRISPHSVPIVDITLNFMTRWTPPLNALSQFISLMPEADVSLFYSEPGASFCGEYAKLTPRYRKDVSGVITIHKDSDLSEFIEFAERNIEDISDIKPREIASVARMLNFTPEFIEFTLIDYMDSLEEARAQRLEAESNDADNDDGDDDDDFEAPF